MSQFPAYVAGRATTARTGPEGAVPVARVHPPLPRPPEEACGEGFLEGVGGSGFPEEAFQRGTPYGAASPHVPGPVDDVAGAIPVTSGPRPPRTVLCVLSDEPRGLQLTALHPHRLRRLVWRPSPTTSQGYGEHARPFPMPVVMIGGIQLSRPYEPRSGGRLVLRPLGVVPNASPVRPGHRVLAKPPS